LHGFAKYFNTFGVINSHMQTRRFILILIVLLPLVAVSQKKQVWNKPLYDSYKFHFGFGFSLGMLDFAVAHSNQWNLNDTTPAYSVLAKSKPIFGASMVTNLKINDFLDLRFIPGLSFGQRDLTYLVDYTKVTTNSQGQYIDENGNIYNGENAYYHNMKIESTYLQFPLLLKYRAMRESNYRPYLVGGLNYTLDLATRKKVKEDELPKVRLKQHDILLELGAGIDFYLPYFKFTTELKFSYGLINMMEYDYEPELRGTDKDGQPYADMFDRIGTKMLTLVIYFE